MQQLLQTAYDFIISEDVIGVDDNLDFVGSQKEGRNRTSEDGHTAEGHILLGQPIFA